MAEPSSRRRTFAADATWPACGRAAWIAGWKLVSDPCSASSDIAHATSAVRTSRSARVSPSEAIAAMNCVPLMSERPSFACSRTGCRPAEASASAPGMRTPSTNASPSPDERQREMSEGRQIAARAHRAARRDVRDDPGVEHRQQQLDGLDAGAGISLRDRVRAQHHRRADDVVGIRLAHAAGVAAQEPQLQLLGLVLGDRLRPTPSARHSSVRLADAAGVTPQEPQL